MYSICKTKQCIINYQYAAMCAGSLMAIAVGANTGWSSPYLPYLLSSNSHIKTTEDEGFWVAIATLLGAPIGSWLASVLIDHMGRRHFIMSLAPICFMGFITIAFANNVWTLIIARAAVGASEGALYIALPMYYSEIAAPKIRGCISSSVSVAALLGVILINVIGPFTDITTSGLLCATFPVLHLMFFWKMPDSPYFLLKKNDVKRAHASLAILRMGKDEKDITAELEEIHAAVIRQENMKEAKGSFADLITVRSNRRAFLIYTILCFTNKFSGKTPVTMYTTIIFERAAGALDAVTCTIIFYIIGMVVTLAAMWIIDRFGRKPMLIFSSIGCSLGLAGCGAYFAAQTYLPTSIEYISWLPMVSLISYNMVFSFGLSFGPLVYLSELFPTNVKAKALFVGDTMNVVLATSASKFFQATGDYVDMYVPFGTFSVLTILGALFIFLYVPETKGKSLEQIQLELISMTSKK